MKPLIGLLSALIALGAAASCSEVPAQQAAEKKANRPLSGLAASPVAGEVAAARVSDPETSSDWPAVAAVADGSVWNAYIEWDGANSDRVVVRRRSTSGEWADPVVLDDGNWDHYLPTIVARPNGVLVLWSGQRDGNFDLYACEISNEGEAGEVNQLTRAPHSDFHVRAASDEQGNVTAVWQSFRDGQADIYARRLTNSGWGREVRVSTSDASDWEPSVALDSTGRAWIAWDSYHAGNYDVFLASFDGSQAGAPTAITSDANASFHSSVAVDSSDRVWVAWDEAGPNWGKDFSASSAVEGSEGLHARRNLKVRVYANGRIFEPQSRLNDVLTGRMSRFAELPTIVIGEGDTPWLVFRHWAIDTPHEMYYFYATRLSADGWTQPVLLEQSSGRNTQRASVAKGLDGAIHAVYSSDGRGPGVTPGDQTHALHYNVYLATLPASEPNGDLALREVSVAPPVSGFKPRERATMTVDRQYTLLLGDCHRHTDIRGHSGVDASTEDTYRYAIDAAQLDFVGPSDHNEVVGGTWPDGLRDYQWWCQQKLADVMSHEPRFWGIYTYEHSMARPGGHRNMLFLKRGAPMRGIDRRNGRESQDNAPPALWEWVENEVLTQAGQKLVIVPHTFAAGPLADWNWPNATFDCLLEMYQGARGSYERWRLPDGEKRGPTQTDDPGHFAQDALDKGNIYGFVSFSDHRSTHNSWAAIWAEHETRESLFDAMLARRTYAASDEILLRVTAAGRMVGEQFTAPVSDPPEIRIEVEAPDEILRVDVVKNGEYVFTQRPGGRQASFTYRDRNPEAGASYYYVRVFQRDAENPEGDPEIAWASPFFVTYE